jgi:hypothetical protein
MLLRRPAASPPARASEGTTIGHRVGIMIVRFYRSPAGPAGGPGLAASSAQAHDSVIYGLSAGPGEGLP